jgi:hypothetical protein
MTIQEIYNQSIKGLSTADRFQLATIILSDISPDALVDCRDDWSEQDLEEASRASMAHVASQVEYRDDD